MFRSGVEFLALGGRFVEPELPACVFDKDVFDVRVAEVFEPARLLECENRLDADERCRVMRIRLAAADMT